MIKILLIDNNDIFREMLRDMLHKQFPAVVIDEAFSEKEVFKKIADFRPHILFLDLQLFKKNCAERACKIREVFPDLIILTFTSNDLAEYRRILTQAKINHVLPKDMWTGKEILSLVKNIITNQEINQPKPAATG